MLDKNSTLRIGIDARPLQGETKHRGIGIALNNLLMSIRNLSNGHKYVYYLDYSLDTPLVLKDLNKNESIIWVKSIGIGRKKYFRSFIRSFHKITPSLDDIDVFLQPDASLGVPDNVPSVVVFYDLIPVIFRKKEIERAIKSKNMYKSLLANELYWLKYKRDLRQYSKAKIIIAISNSARNDYINYFPFGSKQKIHTVSLGVRANTHLDRYYKFDIPEDHKPYILYVGGIDYRKNIAGLLKDFYVIKQDFPALKLVLIGKEFSLDSQLKDLGWDDILDVHKEWKNDVIRPGFVSEFELETYYRNAVVFVFPSLYEGFGLPILEAMRYGCPVIAYNNSSIAEVAGDAALLIKDGQSMSGAISKVLINKKLRTDMVEKGYDRVVGFGWDITASKTIILIEDAARINI